MHHGVDHWPNVSVILSFDCLTKFLWNRTGGEQPVVYLINSLENSQEKEIEELAKRRSWPVWF